MGENKLKLKNININKEFFKKLMSVDIKDIKEIITGENKTVADKKVRRRGKNVPSKLIGFDMGSKNIKVVVGRKGKDKLVIDKMFTIPTPGEIIRDGNIMNVQNLGEIIGYTLEQEKLNVNHAVCTTKSSTILNREIIVPQVEEEEMPTVIKHEIQQYLPINLNDYILQYKILEEIEDDFGTNHRYRASVIAFPEEMAKDYYDLLVNVELKPFALDVDYNSINKLMDFNREVNNYECKEDDTNLLIDIGASSINVSVYNEGKIDFTRMIKSGGDNIDFELSKRLSMSTQSAEEIKIEQGDLYDVSETDLVNNGILDIVNEWISEIERIMQFYRNKNSRKKIDNIYIYGGGSNIKGLEAVMSQKFGINTMKINELSNIEISDKDEPIEEYLNAIGSIIRY